MQPTSTEPGHRVLLDVHSIGLTDGVFYQLCRDNPDLRLELTATGELILMSPSGSRTGHRESRIIQRLGNWADSNGTGLAFSSGAGFTLPNGAKRAPDAAWVRRERWSALTPEQQDTFAPICPDFVVELRSPTDLPEQLHDKLVEYIANGARLGWLLDPILGRAGIYRPGEDAEHLEHPGWLDGETVLPGFRFDFREIL